VDVREGIGIQDHQVRDLALLQGTQVVQASRCDRAVPVPAMMACIGVMPSSTQTLDRHDGADAVVLPGGWVRSELGAAAQ